MSDFAYGVPAPPPPPPSGFGTAPCTLCDAPMAAGAQRCGNCGLWMGGRERFVPSATLVRVAVAFAAVYAATVLLVALAR